MSLPFDEGRDPTRERKDYRTGAQFGEDEFRDKYSQLEYWRNRPLLELQIAIRDLEFNDDPESKKRAQRLEQIESELHDPRSARQGLRGAKSKSVPTSPIRSSRGTLAPSAISGRITGGNYPQQPNVQDIHRGYSQMSEKTQNMLSQRHDLARNQSRNLPQIQDRDMDRHIRQLSRYDTGLQREPYSEQMRMGVDVDRYRQELPRTLAQNFRDLRRSSDRAREQDSKYTKLASLEVWKQRQLDKKYHPKPPQRLPRQHQFGPQQRQQYTEDWKFDARKQMPFSPVHDYFGDKKSDQRTKLKRSTSDRGASGEGESRERSWSRSAPDLSGGMAASTLVPSERPPSRSLSLNQPRRPPFDPERLSRSQTLADRYVNEARNYEPPPRHQRIVQRKQRFPQLNNLQETEQEWEEERKNQRNRNMAAYRSRVAQRFGIQPRRKAFSD